MDALVLEPVRNTSNQEEQIQKLITLSLKEDARSNTGQTLAAYLQPNDQHQLFVALFEKLCIGIVGLENLGGHKYYIRHIAVEPDMQWKGIGNFMLEQLPKFLLLKILETETDKKYVGFFQACQFDVFPDPHKTTSDEKYHCVKVFKLNSIDHFFPE